VTLEDGTHATLNTHTTLSVEYTAEGRDISIASGEVLFEVARDKPNPGPRRDR
jgi:ferric-dicitrate binding protein FerR (iron transport regulator)